MGVAFDGLSFSAQNIFPMCSDSLYFRLDFPWGRLYYILSVLCQARITRLHSVAFFSHQLLRTTTEEMTCDR